MNLTFWGTRGSVPVSGPQYSRYGGATTCIEFEDPNTIEGPNKRIIIDAGTGLVSLGQQKTECRNGIIYQTHMHWDHIQGFPFFAPLFQPTSTFEFRAVARAGTSIKEVLSEHMMQPTFPIGLDIIPASLSFKALETEGRANHDRWEVQWEEMCHPSGSSAYRITLDGVTVVFSGDVEVRQGCKNKLIEFARGADILIMDAQYTEDEYKTRVGFGHSTPKDAVEVAAGAGVSQLYLTHHDPNHNDQALDLMLQTAQNLARQNKPGLQVALAYDGLSLSIERQNHQMGTQDDQWGVHLLSGQ